MEVKNTWYSALVSKTNSMAEELGLDDFSSGRLRDFISDVAREQFKAGNKSGIRWAFGRTKKGSGGQKEASAGQLVSASA